MSAASKMTIDQIRETLFGVEEDVHGCAELAALIACLASGVSLDQTAMFGLQRVAGDLREQAARVREAWRAVMAIKSDN